MKFFAAVLLLVILAACANRAAQWGFCEGGKVDWGHLECVASRR